MTTLALEHCRVWRSSFIASEVVWSHHSRVLCPTNWFPFSTSEIEEWHHINRVFPRHQTSFSPNLSHSHYRELGWHIWVRISVQIFFTQSGTHLHIHTNMCRQTHIHCMTSSWVATWGRGRNRLPPPYTPNTLTYRAHDFLLLTWISAPALVRYIF